jgi:mRNA interferase MazF
MSKCSMLRGEIWNVDLNPITGDEMGKIRPVVIISSDRLGVLDVRIMAPITRWQDRYSKVPWKIRIEPTRTNGLSKTSAVDAYQVRTLSTKRFRKRVGTVTPEEIKDIVAAVGIVIEIE